MASKKHVAMISKMIFEKVSTKAFLPEHLELSDVCIKTVLFQLDKYFLHLVSRRPENKCKIQNSRNKKR